MSGKEIGVELYGVKSK